MKIFKRKNPACIKAKSNPLYVLSDIYDVSIYNLLWQTDCTVKLFQRFQNKSTSTWSSSEYAALASRYGTNRFERRNMAIPDPVSPMAKVLTASSVVWGAAQSRASRGSMWAENNHTFLVFIRKAHNVLRIIWPEQKISLNISLKKLWHCGIR